MRFRIPAQGWNFLLSALNRAISWGAGLGAITHITGPSDQTLTIAPGASQSIALKDNGGTTRLTITTTGPRVNDDVTFLSGTSSDLAVDWSTAQATANCPVAAWGAGTAAQGFPFVYTALANANFDHAHAAGTNPTIFIHSATQSTTQWTSVSHDQTNAVLAAGAGGIEVKPAAHANGQSTMISSVSENLTLSTLGATTDSAIQIPANSFILAVDAIITTAIAGVNSTTVSIGDSTTAARFGTMASMSQGTSTVGITQLSGASTTLATGPSTSSALNIRITLSGGADNTPSAGAVRITAHYIVLGAATS